MLLALSCLTGSLNQLNHSSSTALISFMHNFKNLYLYIFCLFVRFKFINVLLPLADQLPCYIVYSER